MSNLKQLPIIGETYNYFDDGKITESRKIPVIITELIPFENAPDDILEEWYENTDNYGKPHWLYAESTDYFIKGRLLDDDLKKSNQDEVIFVRTVNRGFAPDGGWFSLGWWAGRLDIDGSLTELLTNYNK